MKWFNNPESVEELKKQYKMLIRVCHPDNGGNMDTMKEINAEYDQLYKELEARGQGQGTYNGSSSSYGNGGYTNGGYSNGNQGGYNQQQQPYNNGPYNNSGYNGNYGNYNGSPYYNNRRNSDSDDCCNCCAAMMLFDMCCN
ncbi:hypothetical protein lbkm_1933 [Lachnospiraceae bacterium KM106-2]|nr:hypothetical protein lbkm_1933 [Lachnospiraceae bacterium KM106-2]